MISSKFRYIQFLKILNSYLYFCELCNLCSLFVGWFVSFLLRALQTSHLYSKYFFQIFLFDWNNTTENSKIHIPVYISLDFIALKGDFPTSIVCEVSWNFWKALILWRWEGFIFVLHIYTLYLYTNVNKAFLFPSIMLASLKFLLFPVDLQPCR